MWPAAAPQQRLRACWGGRLTRCTCLQLCEAQELRCGRRHQRGTTAATPLHSAHHQFSLRAVLPLQVRATKSKGYELHARRANHAVLKRRHGRWQQVRGAPAVWGPQPWDALRF